MTNALCELIEMAVDMPGAVAQRAQLKAQLLDLDLHVVFGADPTDNLDALIRYDESDELAIQTEIFYERSIRAEIVSQPAGVDVFHLCQDCATALSKLPLDFKYLRLARAGYFVYVCEGALLVPFVVGSTIHLAIEPVKFLA